MHQPLQIHHFSYDCVRNSE